MGGLITFFPCLGGQKVLLGCGLLGGISTQADTMPERCHWHRSGVLVNFEHISHFALVFVIVNLGQVVYRLLLEAKFVDDS